MSKLSSGRNNDQALVHQTIETFKTSNFILDNIFIGQVPMRGLGTKVKIKMAGSKQILYISHCFERKMLYHIFYCLNSAYLARSNDQTDFMRLTRGDRTLS